jgi:hypothetical protein
MADVFINYRNNDEESAAVLIERDLSTRFGKEKIFRAGRSIEAGSEYPETILDAVRGSRILLAVMGLRWAEARSANGARRVDDEGDWVRRELVEARMHGVRIIPVLVGECPRLDRVDLPDALSWLRKLQFRRFRINDDQSNLDRIAADISSFVPGLRQGEAETGTEDAARQHTVIHDNHGQVHGGVGNMINHFGRDGGR